MHCDFKCRVLEREKELSRNKRYVGFLPSAIVKVLAYALCILLGFIVFLLGSDVFFFLNTALQNLKPS